MPDFQPRFADIRKASLLACVAMIVSLPFPLAESIQRTRGFAVTMDSWSRGLTVLLLLAMIPLSATLPVFLFALYRNPAPLHPSKGLRWMSLGAAMVFGVMTAARLPAIRPFSRDWSAIPGALGQFSNVTYILLLIALFRLSGVRSEAESAVPRLLRLATKTAMIVWGTWVAFHLLRLVVSPWTYAYLRDYARTGGLMGPSFGTVTSEIFPYLVNGICLFAGPYVVYRCIRASGPRLPDKTI